MNRTRLGALNAGLLAVALGLAVALVWQRSERVAWRQKVMDAQARAAAASARAAADSRRPVSQSVSTAVVGASPSSAGAAARAPAASKPLTAEQAERQRIIAAHRQHEVELNALTGYDEGLIALQLPPVTAERAKQIILNERQALEDAAKAMQPASGADGAAVWMAAVQQANQDLQAQLTALLGEPGYQQLEAYHRERHIDWTLGTDLWDASVPLSSDQLHALAVAEVQANFADENWFAAPSPARVPDPATGLSSQDLALLASSGAFLSPAQQDALRQSLIEDHRYNAAMRAFSARQHAAWQAARGGAH